jgi:hypothetical protein
VGLLLLAGCQSDDAPDKTDGAESESAPPMVVPTERSLDQSLSPRALATRYLRYAYRGALLSSDHPLNDSLALLMAGSVGGRALTVIDTFYVESVQPTDSGHTVRARFPRSVDIQSVSWETSAPVIDTRRTLHLRQNHVHEAPHVVGWPAFQRHLRDVAPAAADSVLPRMGTKLGRPPSKAGV